MALHLVACSAHAYTRAPVILPPQALSVLSVAKSGLQNARRAHPDTDDWQPHRDGLEIDPRPEASQVQQNIHEENERKQAHGGPDREARGGPDRQAHDDREGGGGAHD